MSFAAMPSVCHNAVIDGLEMLYALRLAFAPNEGQLEGCIDAWLVALSPYCQAADDVERILQAFTCLAGEVSQWPAPKALIDRLPARPMPPPALPPKVSQAQRLENLQMLDEVAKAIKGRSQVFGSKTGGRDAKRTR